MTEEMKLAKMELDLAENLFNNAATEKEIDYATYRLNAARIKIDLVNEDAKRVN